MKRSIIIAMGLASMASPVFAADSLANFFGNTMHVYPAGGPVHRIYYNADGTYQGFFPDRQVSGTYKIVNGEGEVCNISAGPDGKENTNCHSFDFSKKVGDSWTLDDHGRMISFKLEAGHVKTSPPQ